MEQSKTILYIDDDNDGCELVTVMFKLAGYAVTCCTSAEEGLLRARQGGFGAIVLDNRLEYTSGVEICREIRRFNAVTPIIFFSGESRPQEKQKGIDAGANAYLVKPNDVGELTERVINIIQKHRK